MPLLINPDLERSINLNSPQTPRRPSVEPCHVDTRLLELLQHLIDFPLPLQVVAAERPVVLALFVCCCPCLVGRELASECFAEFEQARGGEKIAKDLVVGGVLEGYVCGGVRREEGCDVGYPAWVGVAGGDEDFLGSVAGMEDRRGGFGCGR